MISKHIKNCPENLSSLKITMKTPKKNKDQKVEDKEHSFGFYGTVFRYDALFKVCCKMNVTIKISVTIFFSYNFYLNIL